MSENSKLKKALIQQLFPHTGEYTYAILDGASVPNLLQVFAEHDPRRICLFRGELGLEVAAMAPYLVELQPDSKFADFVLDGWGRHWGIFMRSAGSITDLRKHFRGFLKVRDPKGRVLYFRYYDPRVLRVYLPTCNAGESRMLFGPVARYLLEDETPNILLRFFVDNNGAHAEKVVLLAEA